MNTNIFVSPRDLDGSLASHLYLSLSLCSDWEKISKTWVKRSELFDSWLHFLDVKHRESEIEVVLSGRK